MSEAKFSPNLSLFQLEENQLSDRVRSVTLLDRPMQRMAQKERGDRSH